jgi:hypothetical protein
MRYIKLLTALVLVWAASITGVYVALALLLPAAGKIPSMVMLGLCLLGFLGSVDAAIGRFKRIRRDYRRQAIFEAIPLILPDDVCSFNLVDGTLYYEIRSSLPEGFRVQCYDAVNRMIYICRDP